MNDLVRMAAVSGQAARTEAPVIAISDLRMEFVSRRGSVLALTDVSVDVQRQEFFSIVGPSGCGKSTLLLLIAGLVSPTGGRLLVGGQNLRGAYTDAAIVFQQDGLLEWRTIINNVLLPAQIRRLDRNTYRRRAVDLLAAAGLQGFEDHYPYQLSGGMRQRAALCRALICNLPLLLMDEPFGALDALTREEHQLMLQDIWLRDRKTVVFVTHDIREAILLSDRVAIISPRPGTVRDIVPIDLPRPRLREMAESPEFNRYVGCIRRILEPARNPQVVENDAQ